MSTNKTNTCLIYWNYMDNWQCAVFALKSETKLRFLPTEALQLLADRSSSVGLLLSVPTDPQSTSWLNIGSVKGGILTVDFLICCTTTSCKNNLRWMFQTSQGQRIRAPSFSTSSVNFILAPQLMSRSSRNKISGWWHQCRIQMYLPSFLLWFRRVALGATLIPKWCFNVPCVPCLLTAAATYTP